MVKMRTPRFRGLVSGSFERGKLKDKDMFMMWVEKNNEELWVPKAEVVSTLVSTPPPEKPDMAETYPEKEDL